MPLFYFLFLAFFFFFSWGRWGGDCHKAKIKKAFNLLAIIKHRHAKKSDNILYNDTYDSVCAAIKFFVSLFPTTAEIPRGQSQDAAKTSDTAMTSAAIYSVELFILTFNIARNLFKAYQSNLTCRVGTFKSLRDLMVQKKQEKGKSNEVPILIKSSFQLSEDWSRCRK